MLTVRKNYLTLVKALGIILMVIGHSGCPVFLHRFIYYFRMPLFFACSGYFFGTIKNRLNLLTFIKKRVSGLYMPYVKWSLLFLIAHNLFFELNIYNQLWGYDGIAFEKYDFIQIVKRAVLILFTMDKHEPLLGGFWFLKTLFLSSILVSSLEFLRYKLSFNEFYIWLFIIIGMLVSKNYDINLPIFGNTSIIFMGCFYYIIGNYIKKFPHYFYHGGINLIAFITLILVAILGKSISMFCQLHDLPVYILLSISGITFSFYFSKRINKLNPPLLLYIIGEKTYIILALHFLSFKIVTLLYIYMNGLEIEQLSSFPTIDANNSFLWLFYSIVGVILPISFFNGNLHIKKEIIHNEI